MKSLWARSGGWVVLVLTTAVILCVLAVLQYRWIGEVAEADRERNQAGLQTAVGQFLQDFNTELLHVCLAFRPDPAMTAAKDWGQFAERYDVWTRTARRPQLVDDLFIWEANYRGEPRLLRLDRTKMRLTTAAPPPWLLGLQAGFLKTVEEVRRTSRRDARLFAWTTDERVPALLRPLVEFSPSPKGGSGPSVKVAGYLLIELDMGYLRDQLLPQLVAQHFHGLGGSAYDVEILDPQAREKLIYRSNPALPIFATSDVDFSVGLIGRPLVDFPRPVLLGAQVIDPEYHEGRWQLLVRYRAGSLAAVTAALRRRNLALSFGVLFLLAASMTMILVFARRAHRLAQLQIDFVAGVSHELRTPLAVICSAADNLADGIVDAAPPVKEYGELIRGEGRRLADMVEQILSFAALKRGRAYARQPVDIPAAVGATLADAATLIERGGVTVEMELEPGLPPVQADEQGVRLCLLNLVSNAVKYSGENRWMAVRARRVEDGGPSEVQITVEDRGPGIAKDELRQIFQPFWRGSAVRSGQSQHGTGLGLSLARDVAQGMGGKITVESTPGRGSAFTLHLPVEST